MSFEATYDWIRVMNLRVIALVIASQALEANFFPDCEVTQFFYLYLLVIDLLRLLRFKFDHFRSKLLHALKNFDI